MKHIRIASICCLALAGLLGVAFGSGGVAVGRTAQESPSPSPSGGAPECSDGIDNDGDGYIDSPNDPGCTGAEDDSEGPADGGTPSPSPSPTGVPQCSDGIDNDGDYWVDYPKDAGCYSPEDDHEGSDSVDDVFRAERTVEIRSSRHVHLPGKHRPSLRFGAFHTSSQEECTEQGAIRLDIKLDSQWVKLRKEQLKRSGWWSAVVSDRKAVYRVVGERLQVIAAHPGHGGPTVWTCPRAMALIQHRH